MKKFNNHWLEQSTQEVTVSLKVFAFKLTERGPNFHYLDLKEGEPQEMSVKVKKHGLSRNEKLAVVVQAALAKFSAATNEFMLDHWNKRSFNEKVKEPIVVEKKFLTHLPEPESTVIMPCRFGEMQ